MIKSKIIINHPLFGSGSGSAAVATYLTSHMAANYAALPLATTVAGELWYCIDKQGTQYLPGSWGGTYYPSGWYLSDGTNWKWQETAFQASQAIADAGLVEDQFISPKTLENFAKWATKQNVLVSGTNIKTINGASILGSGDLAIPSFTPILEDFTIAGTAVTLSATPTTGLYFLDGMKCRVGAGGRITSIVGAVITFDQDYTGSLFDAYYQS